MARTTKILFVILTLILGLGCVLPGSRWLFAIATLTAAGCGWTAVRYTRWIELRIDFLEGTLDAVPQPLTVTDLNMRWVFVNKTTESLLQKTRQEIMGVHCSEWKAHICGTDKCGIDSLRRGCPRTSYKQDMPDGTHRAMQVDTSYIQDRRGSRIGHVEMVTDVHAQNELADLQVRLAQEMTSSMIEIESQTRANATNADQARRVAGETRVKIGNGVSEMQQLNDAMAAINETSREITKINKAIDEIAFQTNILALNAAVEAARAGQAGAGFTVVADEVRNLAGRAGREAGRVTELMERSSVAVRQGSSLAQRVTTSLTAMDAEAQRMEQVMQQIAHASDEQAQGISTVTKAITRLGQTANSGGDKNESTELVNIG